MLKFLVLFALFLSSVFARTRFIDADKNKFLEEVKQEIAAHKIDNKGKIDLQIIKPELFEELDKLYKQEKFTRDELVKIKQKYENFAKTNPANTEEEFFKFINNELDELNKTPVAKIKEGGVCNNWSCDEGLKCAPDPKQEDGLSCKGENKICKDDGDCCSGVCSLDSKTKKRVCDEVYRCYRPLALGQSCMNNPICGEGECLAYNSKTSGIGECENKNHSCKKNFECCSGLCEGNKCVENYICKDCVKALKKIERGQKCCEGLIPNDKNICVPDVPPTVIPQVRNKLPQDQTKRKDIAKFFEFFFESAIADEAYDIINADHDKFESFRAESIKEDAKSIKQPEIKLNRKSNFDTCDIRFRDDFLQFLMKPDFTDPAKKNLNLHQLEMALLSFDFVLSGDGVSDYWSKNGDPTGSIYNRLKTIASTHMANKKSVNDLIDQTNDRLKCMCLDVKGYKEIADPTNKKFFETKCEEYAKYTDPNISFDELYGDASGIKAKRLIVEWTKTLESYNATLTIDNTSVYKSLAEVGNWVNYDAKWNEADVKKYTLFNFNIMNPSGSVLALGGILSALLAAGVIAVLGGFATTSILSTWAVAGIIAASAVTGGTGLWLMASLKGAWITKRPEVLDKFVRSYGCGKKETCSEYSRVLNQPFNSICNVHTSANACIKNFVVFYEGDEPRYVVDPWIPWGVPRSTVLRDARENLDYAHKLDEGFQAARSAMIAKNPLAVGGGSKNGGSFVSENYLKDLFIDSSILGSYTPKISPDSINYLLDEKIEKVVKDAAKKFAVDQKFFEEQDIDNLQKFADYTYEYHFLWPKTSRQKEISYPTIGLSTYLDFMSNGVAASMATGTGTATRAFGGLNQKYLEDYLRTLKIYSDLPINQEPTKLKLINAEIDKVKSEIDNQKTFNALAGSNMDLELMNLNPAVISSVAKENGSANATLTSNQTAFLKAIGTLRVARNLQLKKLENYKSTMASIGNSERAARVTSAANKFSSHFSKPISGAMSIKDFQVASIGSGSGEGANNVTTTSKGNILDNKVHHENSMGANLNMEVPSISTYKNGSGTVTKQPTKNTSEISSEDNRLLQEAIEARDRANKGKYTSKEEQSIFEKVTNAYIRNYDKILSRKKDRDVQEQK